MRPRLVAATSPSVMVVKASTYSLVTRLHHPFDTPIALGLSLILRFRAFDSCVNCTTCMPTAELFHNGTQVFRERVRRLRTNLFRLIELDLTRDGASVALDGLAILTKRHDRRMEATAVLALWRKRGRQPMAKRPSYGARIQGPVASTSFACARLAEDLDKRTVHRLAAFFHFLRSHCALGQRRGAPRLNHAFCRQSERRPSVRGDEDRHFGANLAGGNLYTCRFGMHVVPAIYARAKGQGAWLGPSGGRRPPGG